MDITFTLYIGIIAVCIRYLYKTYLKRNRIAKAIDPLGGETWYPLIGTTQNFIRVSRDDFFEMFHKRNTKYGPSYRSWMGLQPTVHVTKPEHMEAILRSSVNITKGQNYKFVAPWLEEGLITSRGNKWFRHRKLLTPTFHFKILDTMTEIFSEKAQTLLDIISTKANGEFFDVFPLLTHCALDIICETAMGVEINAMEHSDSEYVEAVYGISDVIIHRTFRPFLHNSFIFNLSSKGREQKKYLSILHGFTRKVIADRKRKVNEADLPPRELTEEDQLMGKKKRLAFLDLLLEANRKGAEVLTDEEIREEVDTFMFAGHDTTSATVCWALFAVANHPDVQEQIHQELDGIFQGKDRPITPQDVSRMQYLDRVIKETLRLFTIVPAISRTLEADVEIDGHTVPAGVMVVLHIYEVHRNPEQFPDPERFDPDRFLPERVASRHPYSFVPFSAGPRNCLGQKFAQRNSKVLLATILRKMKLRSLKKVDEMKYYAEIILRPQGGMYLAFEKRELKKIHC